MSPFDTMITVTLHAGGLEHAMPRKTEYRPGLASRLWQWWKDGVDERRAFRKAISEGRWTPARTEICRDAA